MDDTYLIVNGVRVQLTDEQLKALGIEVKKNPFAKVGKGQRYMFIDSDDSVTSVTEDGIGFGNKFYSGANYFNNRAFAEQVALHQLLYRKLLKYAYDNEYHDTAKWDGLNFHWSIYYNYNNKCLEAGTWRNYKQRDVFFSSKEGAECAIEEVIKPFMTEYPDFEW